MTLELSNLPLTKVNAFLNRYKRAATVAIKYKMMIFLPKSDEDGLIGIERRYSLFLFPSILCEYAPLGIA